MILTGTLVSFAALMAIYAISGDRLSALETTTFAGEGLRERQDLQRLLRANVEAIAPDTMVLAEEFGDWDDSRRRIDLLALDRDAALVVIELKRTEDGGHMELQAVRYAAMVSTMTFDQAVDAHARYRSAVGLEGDAREAILAFLEWTEQDDERFAQDVRIVLASAEFSKELTTSVMWLNKRDLDVRCVRLKPYSLNGSVLLDVQQVIPLPEAAAYQVEVRKKEQSQRIATGRLSERHDFWTGLLEVSRKRTTLHSNISPTTDSWIAASAGRSGLLWMYSIRQHDSRLELYIDIGDEAANRAFYNALEGHRGQIEEQFGGPLIWYDPPDTRKCAVRCEVAGGYRDPQAAWPEIHEAMVDHMMRLEASLRPNLA